MNYCMDLFRNCSKLKEKKLFYEVETGQSISFGGLSERVKKLAVYLKHIGINGGDSIVIHLYNSIDTIVIHMAVQYVGARSCFVDALVQPKSLDYYLKITDSRLLVTHCETDQIPSSILKNVTLIKAQDIASLAASDSPIDIPEPYDWPKDEVCYVYFTSGTTSTPKGVMLSRENHENFTRICDTFWKPVTESSRHICFVPFSHGFGTIFLVPLAMRTASTLYILRSFHPLRVSKTIEEKKITHIYGVPSHYQQLLRLPNANETLKGIEMAFCAAAKLEHELMQQFEDVSGTVLCEGYGLIETCCGITWRVGEHSLGTGHMGPLPDTSMIELAILDEKENYLARGKTGQIAVRGPSVMKGYLKNPEETERIMRKGWFLTGDKGHITEDGQLFMTGRIKDIINIAGIKVSPYEVEAVLYLHPAVAEAAVVSAPDALYGEVVQAFVRKKPGEQIVERDLIRFSAERLINFQVPKRIEFVETFPLNNMGKLDRNRLKAMYIK